MLGAEWVKSFSTALAREVEAMGYADRTSPVSRRFNLEQPVNEGELTAETGTGGGLRAPNKPCAIN